MNSHQFSTMHTADGPFSIIVDGNVVIASGWTSVLEELIALVHPDMRPTLGGIATAEDGDAAMMAASGAVSAYYDGDVEAPAQIPVRQHSGPFREHAWEVLRNVSAGKPLTYTEFAARAGRPTAVRAAAGACAQNAAALFVPCHRILRADGSIGGFRYGLEIKRALLVREQTLTGETLV
ncbi:MAG: methylated-DNA--[protein]-cysteine S-methyltransferase [Arachnia sp.]